MVQRISSHAPLSVEPDTTNAISAPLTASLPWHRSMGLGHVHGWWFCGVFCLSITQLKFRLFACAISDNGLSLAGWHDGITYRIVVSVECVEMCASMRFILLCILYVCCVYFWQARQLKSDRVHSICCDITRACGSPPPRSHLDYPHCGAHQTQKRLPEL